MIICSNQKNVYKEGVDALIVNFLAGLFGIFIGSKNRANLLYLYLILYPFDGVFSKGYRYSSFQYHKLRCFGTVAFLSSFRYFCGQKSYGAAQFSDSAISSGDSVFVCIYKIFGRLKPFAGFLFFGFNIRVSSDVRGFILLR